MDQDFVHLHTHSDFSRLDGASKVSSYFTEAARLGQSALAITDHGSMSGHWDAWNESKRTGVKFVAGIEAYVAPDDRNNKESVYWGTEDQRHLDVGSRGKYTHMTMLALNTEGLKNLYRMQKIAATEGFVNGNGPASQPRVDLELMEQYSDGILVTSGCAGGAISTRIRLGQYKEAVDYAAKLQSIYGKENFYVEVMDHGIVTDDLNDYELNEALSRVAAEIKAPLVATNDAHYCTQSDAKLHDAFLCLQTGAKLEDEKRFRFNGEGFYLKSRQEMESSLHYIDNSAITNTLLIAERVESYDEHFAFKNRMPHVPNIDPEFEDEALEEAIDDILAERQLGADYHTRAYSELIVIAKSGFSGYILVLADFLNWCKSQGIRVGPARGSVGGSLVCYLMGITDLDPIVHQLPFERFLNLDRVSFPDIDVDIEAARREEVIQYARDRYGYDNVAQISTNGTIKAKAALKDAGKVLGYDFDTTNYLTSLFPNPIHGFNASLDCVFNESNKRYKDAKDLRNEILSNPSYREIYDLACKLEGLIRNFGVHAAGVIVSSEPLQDIIPLKCLDGELITGFDQPAMEPMGLIKMDFLGLENLSTINVALDNIEKLTGTRIHVEELPLDDPATFTMLSAGNSLGVFQLDSPGMRQLLKRLKPKKFEDISAVLALYRPGPMGAGAHNDFADRANGRQQATAIHPEFEVSLKEVLDETHGVIVYQEQIMKLLQVVAGYSLGQADNVRRIMGKKKPAEMAKLEPDLRQRLKDNGYSDEAFQTLWDILVPFADYSFNKAHTAGYGLIAYWTAYLKANHPVEYFAALLSSEADDQATMALYLEDARNMGVNILPPDINESEFSFTATKSGVRFGLAAIKGVGGALLDDIHGRTFGSLTEFYENISDKVNTRSLQALIAAGAFDGFGDRAEHYEKAVMWLDLAKSYKKAKLHGDIPIITPNYLLGHKQTNKDQMREWEKELVGVELTLPRLKIELTRTLNETEWNWVNNVLIRHAGSQKIYYMLDSIHFTSGQKITPSVTLVKQLSALDALIPTLS